ncbi:hypothetical protein ACFQ6U_13615 [Streptomyces sp. NPDC056465]|uniref:hypothetical protein n=1 Tax=Streptomyces sp. NPDC056465 TaxID=3345829 RepID=UPI0036B7E1C2
MGFNLDERETSKAFASYLRDLEARVAALEGSNPLTNASIESGSLDVFDDEGNLRASLGMQSDGTVALVAVNSDPPPTPTAPTVEPTLAGLVVTWDGKWADSDITPADYATIQIHVSGAGAEFTPDLSSLASTISAPLGGSATVAVDGYAPVWVRLVATNTAAIEGPPSAATQSAARQAVSPDLIDGIITEIKLAQDAVTAAKIALGAVSKSALAQGAVTMNALGGALADGVTQRYIDAMGDAATWSVITKPAGAQWQHLSDIPDAPTGKTVARATGYATVRGTVQVPYDPDVLYRIAARVRTTVASSSGTDTLYIGALGIAADGVTLVSRTGANTASSGHYVAASATPQPVASGWVTYVGYLRGRAAAGANGTAVPAPDPRAPGVMHASTRFISPLLYLNFGSGSAGTTGVMEVDAVTIEVLKTGIVDSTNFVAGSVTTAALAADSVTAGKVAADAIGARELKADSVTAMEILAGAVTTEKLLALAVTAEKIASLAITTDKLSALSVTAEKLAVNSVTATKIAAGTIEATHIKAGAITAEKIDAAALNGKTITGAIVQTAALGDRVVVTNSGSTGLLRFFNAANKLSAEISSNVDDEGMQAFVIQGPDPAGTNWGGRPRLSLSADGAKSTANLAADKIVIGSANPAFGGRGTVRIGGYLNAENISTGRVRITPVANVPTSMTVTGLGLPPSAADIYAVATPFTTVPGTSVKGVGITDPTPRTLTVWLTRDNSALTSVDYIAIATG